MDINGRLSIGAVAKVTGVKIVTIRYYERIGLLPKLSRTRGNYRAFLQSHLRRLLFIRRCRDLGFTLGQVRGLLSLSSQNEEACAEVGRITAQHLKEIDRKIGDLKRLADELQRIKNQCPGKGGIADCRILEALSTGAATRL